MISWEKGARLLNLPGGKNKMLKKNAKNEFRSRAFVFRATHFASLFFSYFKIEKLYIIWFYSNFVFTMFSTINIQTLYFETLLQHTFIFFSSSQKQKTKFQMAIEKYLQQYRVVYKQFGWGIFLIISTDFVGINSFSVKIELLSKWLVCVALLSLLLLLLLLLLLSHLLEVSDVLHWITAHQCSFL